MGAKLYIPIFVLAAVYVGNTATPIYSTMIDLQSLADTGDELATVLTAVTGCISVSHILLAAAGFGALGALLLFKNKGKDIKRVLWYFPAALLAVATLVSAVMTCLSVLTFITTIGSELPKLVFFSNLMHVLSYCLEFAVYLLYTVSALFIGMHFTKKSAE